MSNDPVNILVPGRGLVNASALAVDKAVNEYDERLHFGLNEVIGQWFVYILMERDFPAAYFVDGHPVYPVRGFGFRIPNPEEAVNAIREMDTWQNNFDLAKMNHENEKRTIEQRKANGLVDEAAERIFHAMRKEGMI